MKVGFEPLSKRWNKARETYGWLVVDGEKVTKMRKNEDGSVSIYLFSGSGWSMREGEHKKGTVTVRMPSPS
jgi:hypothetical protein